MHLGFPVAVQGRPGLRAYDSRSPQAPDGSGPHLSVSLTYLRDILRYLAQTHIRFYRLSSRLAPHLAFPRHPELTAQVDQCQAELAHTADLLRRDRVRFTIHAEASVILDSADATLTDTSLAHLRGLAGLLDRLGAGPEGVVVVHTGGVYGDKAAAQAQFCRTFTRLPLAVQARVALENDDDRFGLSDVLWIHRQTGVRLVFDRLHHLVFNPDGLDEFEALALALSTWPRGVRPKVHFASPRTAFNVLTAPEPGGPRRLLAAPRWTQHADYVNPFEFVDWLRRARAFGLPDFDIMLEARGRDLALLRLRADLEQFAPDVRGWIES